MYPNIKEVYVTDCTEIANMRLKGGWKLLETYTGDTVYFVLGRPLGV